VELTVLIAVGGTLTHELFVAENSEENSHE
jgi:hypothetical protein